MKRYKKKPTKLLQIRLAEKEHAEVLKFINSFGVTQRELILTVTNELKNMTVIKDGYFWESWKDYAYCNRDKWDKKLTSKSVCEICDKRYPEGQHGHDLVRHHHDGYDNDNAFKTRILCRKCHGLASRGENKALNWEEFLEKYKE